MTTSANFFPQLGKIYPADRLLTDPAHRAAYESDGLTAFKVLPRAVVMPESADEVIDTVRLCRDHGIPFTACGSGTSLSGGSVPVKDGIVIALNRMNRILLLDAEQRIAVVEPGVINLEVTEAARPYGLHFAPDPSSQSICTIGRIRPRFLKPTARVKISRRRVLVEWCSACPNQPDHLPAHAALSG